MNPFEAFGIYTSLKLHFNQESYDAIKYNYQSRVKKETFWKRKDKYYLGLLKTEEKMDKKVFFQSSLPRAGSTLLQNILGQNPEFYVTPTSGV